MNIKQRAIIAAYLIFCAVLGYVFVSKFYFKPEPLITSIDYDLKTHGGDVQLVFDGTVLNAGWSVAYDTEVFVTWVSAGGDAYTESCVIGSIRPGTSTEFHIAFNPEDPSIKYHSQWIEFSMIPRRRS